MRVSPVLVSTALLIAAASCPVLAEQLPKIQTDCKTDFQARQPIYLGAYGTNNSDSPSNFEQEQQIKQAISKLIGANQWDEALTEIEKLSSDRFRDEMRLELVEALSRAKESDRALRLVVKLFPQRTSYERAKGVGMVAAAMVANKQFPQALEALKFLPADAQNASSAVTPVVYRILVQDVERTDSTPASSQDIEQIRQVVSLFRGSEIQLRLWRSIGEKVNLVPAIALQLADLSPDAISRTTLLEEAAQLWFRNSGSNVLQYGGEIANRIESCVVRSRTFLELADRITSGNQFDNPAKFQLLNQVEALINAIDQEKLGDRQVAARLRLTLAELNFKLDRTAQALKLVDRVVNDQKKFQFHADRAELLAAIAPYYYHLKQPTAAIRTLELAETAAQTAYLKRSLPLAI